MAGSTVHVPEVGGELIITPSSPYADSPAALIAVILKVYVAPGVMRKSARAIVKRSVSTANDVPGTYPPDSWVH